MTPTPAKGMEFVRHRTAGYTLHLAKVAEIKALMLGYKVSKTSSAPVDRDLRTMFRDLSDEIARCYEAIYDGDARALFWFRAFKASRAEADALRAERERERNAWRATVGASDA